MLPNEGIRVTAALKIKPEVALDEGLAAVQKFCQDMNSEPGCLFAYASQDLADERQVHLWEAYRDQAAIDAHFNMPHTRAFIKQGYTELVHASQSKALGE
ncbi:putative quinol monooxygenase [Endozoicomonadaceae bacterium StTr2]